MIRWISEAFVNMWRNKATTFFALISVTASLVVLGIMFAIILNINSVAMSAKERFDTIVAFLEDDASDSEITTLVADIMMTPGVLDIKYESKDEAMQKLKERWGEGAYLLEGIEGNPLPRSVIVQLRSLDYAESVTQAVSQMEHVEEVKSYQHVVNQLLLITSSIRKSGTFIIFVLIGVSIILINNAISMAVASRSKEISIMKYVGATDWYIRWPFFVEGILVGLMGAGLSYLIIYYAYKYVYELAQEKFFALIAVHLVLPERLESDIGYLFVVIGVCVGALGSLISTRKPLNK